MNWADWRLALGCALAAGPAMAAEPPIEVDGIMHELADLDQTLSVENLDRAHEVQARLELLDQLESKLLEIAKKRLDLKAIESGRDTAPDHEGDDKPLLELEADPRVVDIVGHGHDLTARLVASDHSTFAVKVGSKLGNYRIEAISAATGVEVADAKGRRHNLPEIEEAETSSGQAIAGPVPPPGVVPTLPKR